MIRRCARCARSDSRIGVRKSSSRASRWWIDVHHLQHDAGDPPVAPGLDASPRRGGTDRRGRRAGRRARRRGSRTRCAGTRPPGRGWRAAAARPGRRRDRTGSGGGTTRPPERSRKSSRRQSMTEPPRRMQPQRLELGDPHPLEGAVTAGGRRRGLRVQRHLSSSICGTAGQCQPARPPVKPARRDVRQPVRSPGGRL